LGFATLERTEKKAKEVGERKEGMGMRPNAVAEGEKGVRENLLM